MLGKNETKNELAGVNGKVDFTLLDARATFADLEKLCDVAYKNGYYSVCVNPSNVAYVKGYIAKNLNNALRVVSVIGFPLGANSTNIKLEESKECLSCGADEIDVKDLIYQSLILYVPNDCVCDINCNGGSTNLKDYLKPSLEDLN